MAISPNDIYEKSFKKSFKGYDVEEVDAFLDEIIVELQNLASQRDILKEEVIKLRQELDAKKDSEVSDEVIAEKLMSAQKSADLIMSQARSAAKFIVADAQKKAKSFIDMINVQVVDAKYNISALKQFTYDYKANFQNFLSEQIDGFNENYLKIMKIFNDVGTLNGEINSLKVPSVGEISEDVNVNAIKDFVDSKDEVKKPGESEIENVYIDINDEKEEAPVFSTQEEIMLDHKPELIEEVKVEPKYNPFYEAPAGDENEDDDLSSFEKSYSFEETVGSEDEPVTFASDEEREKLRRLIDDILTDN